MSCATHSGMVCSDGGMAQRNLGHRGADGGAGGLIGIIAGT